MASTQNQLRIGFVGLGGMGRGVVRNIAPNGLSVTATDIDGAKVADVQQYGVSPASKKYPECAQFYHPADRAGVQWSAESIQKNNFLT